MPVQDSVLASVPDMTAWRHHLHSRPELLYDVEETAAFVAEKLTSFGCDEVATAIGRTGVVAVIEGRRPGAELIALRSDMDALPIAEQTSVPYASTVPGKMHACGHDGHMAMLLGAARELARTRDFAGRVALVFQPAEEGGAGAKAMIEDGLFARFPASRVFGMHNLPGLPVGHFATRAGPIMAATDEFQITLSGRGGHAALPHLALDPVLAGASLVQNLQQIVARGTDPLDSLVLSVTQFHAGFVHNVIPDEAVVSGTVRSLRGATRDRAEARIREIAAGTAAAFAMEARVDYDRNYPVTVNEGASAALCARVAGQIAGVGNATTNAAPLMAGEDFSYMLEERPGALIFIGNGASAPLHNPAYDFDDRALASGAAYWVALVEEVLGSETIN